MEAHRPQGLFPPMVTPFLPDGELDQATLAREARRLLSAGVHGLSFGGSTGEGALLSDRELETGVRTVRGQVGPQVPILCGIIRNSTRDGISAALAAKRGGADYLMITPTYYHGADARGNAAYYQAIYKATGMKIIIYNVISNNPILPAMVPELKKNPGLVGIKQSVGGIHALADMLLACGEEISVFGAQDDVMYLSYLAGAKGAISAILTLFPEECVAQWRAVQAGDLQTARSLNDRMLPVWRAIEGGAFPGRLKTALRIKGIEVGDARSPILPTDGDTEARIRERMRQNGFIH